MTHLFADGGRIIKTTRVEYAEHLERPDLQNFVRGLMKDQHKDMFTALRLGDLDVMLEDVVGKFDQPLHASKAPSATVTAPPPPPPVVTVRSPARDFETPPLASAFGDDERSSDRSHTLSNPNLRRVTPTVPPAVTLDVDMAALERLPQPVKPSPPPPLHKLLPNSPPGTEPAPSPVGVSRPASRFAAVPSKSSSSIFGDGVISEQSLDEVILSYLAEDLDGSSE